MSSSRPHTLTGANAPVCNPDLGCAVGGSPVGDAPSAESRPTPRTFADTRHRDELRSADPCVLRGQWDMAEAQWLLQVEAEVTRRLVIRANYRGIFDAESEDGGRPMYLEPDRAMDQRCHESNEAALVGLREQLRFARESHADRVMPREFRPAMGPARSYLPHLNRDGGLVFDPVTVDEDARPVLGQHREMRAPSAESLGRDPLTQAEARELYLCGQTVTCVSHRRTETGVSLKARPAKHNRRGGNRGRKPR